MPRRPLFLCGLILAILAHRAVAHPATHTIAQAAVEWLGSLDDRTRAGAVFALDDDEREDWHFVPRSREGVPLREMTPAQRAMARGLIAATLSERGLLATDAIIALEEVLHLMEGSARRDRGLYYFSVFGKPSDTGTWGWRVEGHHLSINITIVNGALFSTTPMFFGANPAEVRIDHPLKGRRALASEEDLARAFMQSLDPEQRRSALISNRAPRDIITGADRKASLDAPTGLPFSRMSDDQKARLRELLNVYIGRLRTEVAATSVQKIENAGWDSIHFAWAGSLEPGEGHYYRIHGSTFVVEYDNVQNGANHIHTTWRDFEGDFGRDLLRQHYRESHGSR